MNRASLKLLVNRTKLALGSLSLVEKQLLDICTSLDNQLEILYDEPIRGEENHQRSFDDPSVPPLSAYEKDA